MIAIPMKMNETATLMPVPTKKARKEPNAAWAALPGFDRSYSNSPTRAPKNGPSMIPVIPNGNPANIPAKAPYPAYFEPPNLRVIQEGNI